ncbi:hypothetical protein Peur_038235 [Populus x canadensis]
MVDQSMHLFLVGISSHNAFLLIWITMGKCYCEVGRGRQGLSDQGMEQSMAVPSCSKTSDQNSSHLTKNSPKFRLRAASHGSEYLPIAFNLKRDPNMVSYKPSSDSEITELHSITQHWAQVTWIKTFNRVRGRVRIFKFHKRMVRGSFQEQNDMAEE